MPIFKGLPMSDRKYISWLLGVLLGRPAVQTRFRGLHRIIAGRLYLKAVITVRIYAHGVIQVDPVEEEDAGLQGDNEQPVSGGETLERAASSSDPQRQQQQLQQDVVVVSNPLFFPDIAAYAQRMQDDNIDVMAFPYIDDFHHQLSGPFVQSDGLKPSWAVTNCTTNRVEGAHKDAKHTEGSGSALSLVAFARQRLNLAVGARDAFFTRWQARQQLATSRQRLQSQARRAESWFSSPNSSLVVLPGAPLSSAAAQLAGMLPATSALQKLFDDAFTDAGVGCYSTAAPFYANSVASAVGNSQPVMAVSVTNHGDQFEKLDSATTDASAAGSSGQLMVACNKSPFSQ
eukprot:gene12265-12403_t